MSKISICMKWLLAVILTAQAHLASAQGNRYIAPTNVTNIDSISTDEDIVRVISYSDYWANFFPDNEYQTNLIQIQYWQKKRPGIVSTVNLQNELLIRTRGSDAGTTQNAPRTFAVDDIHLDEFSLKNRRLELNMTVFPANSTAIMIVSCTSQVENNALAPLDCVERGEGAK